MMTILYNVSFIKLFHIKHSNLQLKDCVQVADSTVKFYQALFLLLVGFPSNEAACPIPEPFECMQVKLLIHVEMFQGQE